MHSATVVVATPSPSDWHRCRDIIALDPALQIVGHAPGLMELFSQVEAAPPNLVMVSARLCQVPEFDLIVALFKALDVRWVTFERGPRLPDPGAAPVFSGAGGGGLFSLSLDDDPTLLVRHLRAVVQAPQSAPSRPAPRQGEPAAPRYRRVVLIGASTGGIEALKTVLAHFAADCPPTVIVQHIAEGFGRNLASTLARCCSASVHSFAPGIDLRPGMICVVAGQPHHAVLAPGPRPQLAANTDPPMSGHCPSVDKLFLSALPYANRIVAAVLTGMGRDGADGLLALREAGARTLAQDERTSVVYGMPGAAWSNGAAMDRLPLKAIGPALLAEARK